MYTTIGTYYSLDDCFFVLVGLEQLFFR